MTDTLDSTHDRDAALGAVLVHFDAALKRLRSALAPDAQLTDAVFEGAEEWSNLLSYKLVPHLAGEGCLIVAVTGGTNTGKSTVFNMLIGREASPTVATAAATARPVIAANEKRARECLEGKLVPEFLPTPLRDTGAVVERVSPPNALFVTVHDALPDRIVMLDTPDVDSIEREHWAVADSIRAAGDVLIAVLTGEKYKDERVVAFFRQALASGRVVVPLMNKANPDRHFEVARKQLAEFRQLVGCDAPSFVLPHDFDVSKTLGKPIQALDDGPDLMAYIKSLDVPAIKQRVYRGTVAHFAQRADEFIARVDDVANSLRTATREFEERAHQAAQQYDPTPGAAIGGLFHEFVQSKRSLPFKMVGAAGRAFATTVSALGRSIRGAVVRRATLEPEAVSTDQALRAMHAESIERIARGLAASYFESVRNLREPAAHLIQSGLRGMDTQRAIDAVIASTLRSDNVSEEFRAYANQTLETWWQDHRGKRIALQMLDGILAVAPAAFAGVLAAHTAGMGVDVALAVGGPMAEQFAARVIEYQFGDALFDFLTPWRNEQRATFEKALLNDVTAQCLRDANRYLAVFDGDIMAELRRLQALCSKA